MLITASEIKRLIQKAKLAGADPVAIQELQDHLVEIESGQLASKSKAVFGYEKPEADGSKTVCVSTAPIKPEDDDDLKDILLEDVKKH